MKLSAVIAMTLVGLALVSLAAPRSSAAPTPSLSTGDQLVYSVTVELQQHHVKGGSAKTKTQDNMLESSAQGTETFSVYAIGSNGTAYANVALDFKGVNQGQPVTFETTSAGKILPDGQLRVKAQVGLGVSDAIGFANSTTLELGQHAPLGVGKAWTNSAKTPFIAMTMSRKVVARANYRGVIAVALQSTGTGELLRTVDGKPTAGSITVSGTTYYDDQHRLIIGEALRTLTVVQQPDSAFSHDDYSSALNVVLNTWRHSTGSSQPAGQQPAEEASPEATEAATPTYAPPALYGPTPYPTVTPRSGV